ncbi:MAG: hypothetical protein KDD11_06615 [Acidobacteria bacterium]|nr:hypothetical protein [Acidobacteriota bacterium]
MESDRISALGDWRVDASQCRCLPVFSMLRLDRDDQGGIHLRVSWGDADQEAVLTRSGGKLETGRATFLFSTADGEQHLLVAAVHAEPRGRRRLFGFISSRRGREETGTGAWTAHDVDPDGGASG